jgi:hypothetical protein
LQQTQGIAQSDIDKLVAGGYFTCQAVAMASRKELTLCKGMSEAKVNSEPLSDFFVRMLA